MLALTCLLALLPASAIASIPTLAKDQPTEQFISATARTGDGKLGYTEKHEITLKGNGQAVAARTEYYSPNNSLAATLESRFERSVAASDYTFSDFRDGSSHGVEIRDDGYLVWKKEDGRRREERLFKKDQFQATDLVVAGQGLFFYLRENLPEFSRERTRAVKLLIPGRLDYFSFHLSVEDEDDKFVSFKLRPDSLLVRIFLQSLRFQFNKETREIVKYSGPSNLVERSGKLQNVVITYEASTRRSAPQETKEKP